MEPGGAALVTGASRGIGRATAIALARAGFDVVAAMRDAADGADLPSLAAGGAGSLRVAQLDVTRPGSFEVPAELRVLVNNAGIERENLPVEVLDLVHWRELFETNVFGTVEMTRRAIPALRAAGGGVICNATSASLLVPMPFFSPYRASKAAVAALGESLQAEVAPFGIRVVEVLPGPVDTDMLRASSEVPEGIEVEGYRALAELVGAARAGFTGSPASPAEAADRIVAAILDDGAPLRVACDPIGDGLLEAWRTTPGHELLQAYLEGFAVDPED